MVKKKETLQDMLYTVGASGRKYGMDIYIYRKFEGGKISKKPEPLQKLVGNKQFQNVDQLKFIGSLLLNDAYSRKEWPTQYPPVTEPY